ncbi:MAG: hypothetical protein A3B86_03900 [Candidatus Yanofskybacteria bacterium RIFCSPHIGHO2_02_FULL_38_22b]|uniref:Uncharacterized protein n=1 Tax=Candidatus Yanofskybacteria bacterium RIFCSPHIGHO2_02_FULL_38_22b TaxID=1802673 RepID=A0A1F8EZD5_9BACT|nr:MAG: hypothetical protein A2816_01670 [Candidatus Yanofskybacteria bacterium RIFCSPHIGHO2_01_FULL_39_44]OGN06234.1 MAG: hypothetical protein A3B86_03900 [Candidatus Yanofskybacteria bacterium RIFCSPHIGHO2_02_FULL_38_22b]OGN19654.1 MAG: hypothetical protein A2910_03635 [Candidatus Yanofskybacteria bacterium RIFCSPLOWO2_01_FULL_39_28]
MELGLEKIEPTGEQEMADKSGEKSRREIFFRRVRSKFMAMAMAGFITLGSAGRIEANQIQFDKKGESAPEFVLEPAITQEKLHEFEEYLKKEEPESIEWLAEFETRLIEHIDRMSEKLLNLDPLEDKEAEEELDRSFSSRDSSLFRKKIYGQDHKVLEFFKSHPQELNEYQNMLKESMRKILLSAIMLDNSPAIRKKAISSSFPIIILKPHDVSEIRGVNGYIADKPFRIVMTPRVFLGHDGKINPAAYINFMVHEIIHTLRGHIDITSILHMLLNEGSVQNNTYEVIQFIQSSNPRLKNVLGYKLYDNFIIPAAIFDAIAKSHGSGDAVARWSAGLIDDDELIKDIREAAKGLGIDSKIADDLKNFGMRNGSQLVEEQLKFTASILSRLQNSGLTLPPDFIENILTRDRFIESNQRKQINKIIDSLDSFSE